MGKEFIEQQKKLYRTLKPCFCTVLGEEVFFTADGLHHLLYYRRRPRSMSERNYRAGLIQYIVEVIEESQRVERTIMSEDPLIVTFALEHKVVTDAGEKVDKVVLRKNGRGKLHFLSVMARKGSRQSKKPKSKS